MAGEDDSNIELTEDELEDIQEEYAPRNMLDEAIDELIDNNDYEDVNVAASLI